LLPPDPLDDRCMRCGHHEVKHFDNICTGKYHTDFGDVGCRCRGYLD
jgi:hypothetical protein